MTKARAAAVELPNMETLTAAEAISLETEDQILAEFDLTDENVLYEIRAWQLEPGKNTGQTYLFACDGAEVSGILDRVRDTYGSGSYRFMIYRTVGNQKQLVRNAIFKVRSVARPNAPVSAPSEMAAVLAAFQQQNDRILAALEKRQEAPPAPQLDPMAMFEKTLSVVTNIMKVQPQQVQHEQRPQRDPEMNTMAVFMKGVEFAKGLVNDGEKKDIWDVLLETLKQLPAMAQLTAAAAPQPQLGAPQQRRPGIRQVAPNGTGQPTGPAPAQPSQTTAPPNEEQLRQILLYLCKKAQADADADLYAEWLVDEIGMEPIILMLAQPNLFELLAARVQEIAPHRKWFGELIAALQDIVQNAGNEEQQPAPGTHEPVAETSTVNVDTGG
jgi:hypothetical protein